MRRSSVALISLIGPLILGACTERDSTAPRSIAPGQPNAAVLVAATTCDANAIRAAQSAYFTSNQDSSGAYISDLKKAYGAADYSTANAVVYKIGRLVAKERLTPATTDAVTGGIFLTDVLRCLTNQSVSPVAPEDISKFAANATAVVKSGIWEIRGGSENSEVPAAGRVIDNTSQVRAFGLPRWGAEAAGAEWPGATQYVVFGYPTNFGTVVTGSATNINTNEVPANAFELGTIPSGTSKSGIRVGVCINEPPPDGTTNRIVHNNAEILDNSPLTALCGSGYSASAEAASGAWYANVLQRAATLLAPKPLFAQSTCGLLCVGGLPSDWSPFGLDAITAGNIVLDFVQQPANTVVNLSAVNDSAVVRARINGAAVPGVAIDSILVAGNSGTPANAVITAFAPATTTSPNGTAKIRFAVGKAGGYTVTVYGHIDTFITQSATSALFNVKNP